MAYKTVNNVFLDGNIVAAGTVVEIKDADVAKALLERGSIVDTKDEPAPAPAEEVKEAAVDSAAPLESTSEPTAPETASVPTPQGTTADEVAAVLEATAVSTTPPATEPNS